MAEEKTKETKPEESPTVGILLVHVNNCSSLEDSIELFSKGLKHLVSEAKKDPAGLQGLARQLIENRDRVADCIVNNTNQPPTAPPETKEEHKATKK